MTPGTRRFRVAFDSSSLLGNRRRYLMAGTILSYYEGYWSTWIVSEFTRKRTEWIAERAFREGVDRAEHRRRLAQSRQRVNTAIQDMSSVLRSVDYMTVPTANVSWLPDPDDVPVIRTAIAADADILVTENSRDFPLTESRNGILFLNSAEFLRKVAMAYDNFLQDVRALLEEPELSFD